MNPSITGEAHQLQEREAAGGVTEEELMMADISLLIITRVSEARKAHAGAPSDSDASRSFAAWKLDFYHREFERIVAGWTKIPIRHMPRDFQGNA
ncbi:hypothetical protein EYF80_034494 [Liparis tanakae]|uniref:Uncharacterized protein n=1 Tax=Liparis tanakae TaxID=230148 RepID=A0A4Z2GRL0_9TELE|nr:hypothetical protein EYF80_034494 [Liparis tanakae]